MKRLVDWQILLGIFLVFLTTFFYGVHYFVFRDVHHIFLYFIGDVAFVFFEVLLVTLVIHRLLHHREKLSRQKKINMLIGAFFSEVGTELLRQLVVFEGETSLVSKRLAVPDDWSERSFLNIRTEFIQTGMEIDLEKGNLETLRNSLQGKKAFLLDLLMNSNLQENEAFTNLVWAVFHLMEELDRRNSLENPAGADRRHLEEDIQRVYHLLLSFWMDFIQHLNQNYPFMHSLAVRTNPFDEKARAEVS